MNRAIKLRVWDKEEEYFVNIEEDPDYMLGFDSDGSLYVIKDGSPESEKYILLQYTGLKDKNGKEICEGDIMAGKVRWDNKPFVVRWGEYSGNHSVGQIVGFELPDKHLYPWEVIGNIYENPELLNLK